MSVKLTEADALKAISTDHGLLRKSGWINSHIKRLSVDENDKPIPWYTYAATAFLGPRLNKDMMVFEFGAGYSTLWYAERVKYVYAVEHNEKWYGRISTLKTNNIDCRWLPSGRYADEMLNHKSEIDIVAIDGAERVNCVITTLQSIKHTGCVVFDNSTDANYQEGYNLLAHYGFRRLDFHGLTPVCAVNNCTSIFYRPTNNLGI